MKRKQLHDFKIIWKYEILEKKIRWSLDTADRSDNLHLMKLDNFFNISITRRKSSSWMGHN